jgi:hypothetical protein
MSKCCKCQRVQMLSPTIAYGSVQMLSPDDHSIKSLCGKSCQTMSLCVSCAFRKRGHSELTKPLLIELTKPLLIELTKPLLTELTKPVATELTKPLLIELTKPLATEEVRILEAPCCEL